MRKVYDKLVRDRIPDRLDAAGVGYGSRVADPREMRGLLLAKLDEEVAELKAAAPGAATTGEAADVVEVVRAIAKLDGYGPDALEVERSAKEAERGGFERGVVLLWADD
jgi:predicted house-cleaning noncanonical NTP pyrophosphatase (MazG superfamily)